MSSYSKPGYSGSAQPEGSGLKSGHSGNQTKLNLNLYDDAHDNMIYSKISLGMLQRNGWIEGDRREEGDSGSSAAGA